MRAIATRRNARDTEEINIAPLIDMVFILLIFFMVSTTFVRDLQLDLERPGASTAAVADTRAVRVQVDRRGSIFLDGQAVQPWMLEGRVRDRLSNATLKTVVVTADKSLDTGALVDVVDACRMAGAEHVGLAVEER